MATRMQQRRGTAAKWTAANPILAAGEFGYETDTGKFKIGDGTNTWSNIEAFSDASAILGAAPATLDTLEELAAAIDNNPDFFSVVGGNTTSIANLTQDLADATTTINGSIAQTLLDANGYTDTEVADAVADLEVADSTLQSNIDSANLQITAVEADVTTLSGRVDDADAAIAQEVTDRDAAIAAFSVLTANVHGIADTTVLATTTNVSDAQAAAEATAEAYADGLASNYDSAGAASSAVTSHNAETTSVHGIADTSLLATTSDVSTAQTAAQTYADGLASNYDAAGSAATAQTAAEGHADGEIVAHAAVTTNVHGIADTSDLALLSAVAQTFDGDITVAGNFTVSGTTTTVSTQDLVVNDPMIYIGEGSTGNTADLGLVGSFDDGIYQHSGIVRDSSEGIWKLFKGVTDEPSTTINFGQGSLDDLAVNNVEVAGVVFTDGTQTKVGVPSITPISEKTASYTLSATTERDTIVEVNSSSATTLTIPTDATLDFPVGTTLDVIQTGTGQVTIAGEVGVTVNATPGLKLRAQWSSVTLLKRGANNWLVFGDTSA
jgi:hypothetical protein